VKGEVRVVEFVRAWWKKTSRRARKGWKYIGIGVVLLAGLNVVQLVSLGVAVLVGFLGVSLTVVGVALVIWGSTDVDDLRSYRS
jgi:protein-S-isoprenylcysteine O-methyltransferase Ste14